jgi:hypothetical protein
MVGTRETTISRWEKEQEVFKEYVNENGFPTIREWDTYAKENGLLLSSTFMQRLGNWGRIAVSFGYPQVAQSKEIYADEELLNILKSAIKDHQTGSLTRSSYNAWAKNNGYPSADIIANRIARGLWKKAVEKAME